MTICHFVDPEGGHLSSEVGHLLIFPARNKATYSTALVKKKKKKKKTILFFEGSRLFIEQLFSVTVGLQFLTVDFSFF